MSTNIQTISLFHWPLRGGRRGAATALSEAQGPVISGCVRSLCGSREWTATVGATPNRAGEPELEREGSRVEP